MSGARSIQRALERGATKWILVAGWQRRASLWDASKGEFKWVLCDDRLKGNPLDHLFSDVAASADGERVALGAASGKIHIFNVRSIGQDGPSLKFEKSLDPIDKNTNPLPYSLVFDPQNHDRLLAAYMPSSDMALWKVDENVFSTFGDGKSGPVWRVAFDPEGEFVASATITGKDGKKYSGTLPEEFGEASAAAVSANGAGIAIVPRSGQPVLLLNFSDHLITVSVTLCGVKAEWTAVAFIEGNSRIAARTKEGKIFAWPFYSDVRSLEELAKEHLPLVRHENGLDKRLVVPAIILRGRVSPEPAAPRWEGEEP